jgi:glycopeptide antibiotics resistance protein
VKTRATARAHLAWLAFGYLLFVIYGSLVPLDFHALPLHEALARFRQVPWLDLGIASRADWVANLLLFIPLAFMTTGALAHGRGPVTRIAVSALLPLAGFALAVGIEFTQVYFPQRTVSQNDILAETLGGVLGVAAWWAFGPRLLEWYASWLHVRAPAALSERLAWAYVVIAFAYGVLPLDLTISAVELYHKWNQGKLVLLPFSALPADPAQAAYELLTDVLLWLPPALLWTMAGTRTPARAWRLAVGLALLLEVLQLFVYSRVTDLSDVFAAALGAGIGVWLGSRLGRRAGATPAAHSDAGLGRWLPLLLALAWLPVLMTVFWYPFDFHTDGSFVRERLASFQRVPFEIYYFGTEFRAITSLLQKMSFFAPLGALLAWWVSGLPWLWRTWGLAASLALIVLAALGIELGQVLLPDKYPDSTDWLLQSLGGLLGYGLARAVHARVRMPAARRGRRGHWRGAGGEAA